MHQRMTLSVLLTAAVVAALTTVAAPAATAAAAKPAATKTASAAPTCKTVDKHWRDGFNPKKPAVEGFPSADSVVPGTPVDLYISTQSPQYRVKAYRLGNYGGKTPQACLVWTSKMQDGQQQPDAIVRNLGETNTVIAPWSKSMTVSTTGWVPGMYLLRMDNGSDAGRNFMPLVVRTPSFSKKTVLVMPNTTWQAYNRWGGYSLYYGPGKSAQDRSRAVSFDRPYDWYSGPADVIQYVLPFLSLAEQQGVPLAYATDIDLKTRPDAFMAARTIVSVGHDEYYSPEMRQTLEDARAHGVNLGFMGANDVYRRIRFGTPAEGGNRLVINYKDNTDPILDPTRITTQWNAGPVPRDEGTLLGSSYLCSTKSEFKPIVVVNPDNWLFAGTGAKAGLQLPQVAGQEYNGVNVKRIPGRLEILFHSPIDCHGQQRFQDTTYYTTSSNAGVFHAGAYFWACAIGRTCNVHITPKTSVVVSRITANFLREAAAGPLGKTHASVTNLSKFYPNKTAKKKK